MIQELHIRNFQCHRRSVFHFASGLNVLVGPTDQGKSSALRAIRWVTDNRPIGDVKTHRATADARVEMRVFCDVTGNVDKVIRRKGIKANAYGLNDAKFVAFGKGVPDAIVDVLAFDASLNYQKQSEPFFLIGLPNGHARGQFLAKFCDMTIAEASIRYGQHEVKRLTSDMFNQRKTRDIRKASCRNRKECRRIRLELMEPLRDDFIEFAGASKACNRLTEYVEAVQEAQRRLVSAPSIALASKALSVSGKMLQNAMEAQQRASLLESMLVEHARVTAELSEGSKIGNLADVQNTVTLLEHVTREASRLTEIVNAYQQAAANIGALQAEADKMNKELKKFKNCPLCGGTLK